MGRPKGSKNKKSMPEENKPDVSTEAPMGAAAEQWNEPLAPIPSPEDAWVLNPVTPAAEPAVVAGDMSGYKSCVKCGRDEAPAFPLNSEKLCSNCSQ